MSPQLRLLQLFTPAYVRLQSLETLFEATADAFGVPRPPNQGRTVEARLREFATFTAEQAERALARGWHLSALQRRLRRNAFSLGATARRRFRPTGQREVMALARVLYQMIGIDFSGGPGGEIVIRKCHFSHHYSPRACHLMSALDEGLLAGLAGGGTLTFRERITEGASACRACFHQEVSRGEA